MRADKFFLQRRMRGMKHDLPSRKVHIGVRVDRRHNLHRFADRLPESFAVRFVAEMLCKLIPGDDLSPVAGDARSEEHTSELQSLMRISYAVFCLKKKKTLYN